MLRYTKTIIFLVNGLKVVAKCCLNWISSHDGLFCRVEYSNIENQVEIFKTYHEKVMIKSKWLSLVLDVDFLTLIILKLEFSFIFLEFVIYLRASSQNLWKPLIFSNFFVLQTNFRQTLVQYHLLANHLYRLLKYVDFS